MLDSLTEHVPKQDAVAIVVPHAGYVYSGRVAGTIYSRIRIPSRCVILCPNHTGLGVPLSIMRSGAWETPLGRLSIDTEMCDALLAADRRLEDDVLAHRREHALEVQLPFLQHLAGPDIRFVPITVGTGGWDELHELGQAIAAVIADVDPTALIIASSDMNHYETDAITRMKDAKAIAPMLQMDPRALWETVHRERISMCGYGPATAMLVAARLLGANHAELVQYATSADVSHDYERVVGYAGIVVQRII